ncbi:MAG TPA: ABC transporter ATP-binding protein [Dehalococcoidia bacterium]|nr:ABC transporter ATP-binding protein [Dehalococcoidia bacterium]
MELLKAEGVSKNFDSLYAVQNVSLSVSGGERRAIIGPNGAGKTTLFNLLAGELEPCSGRIYLFGQDVTTTPVHQRVHLGLARTFQIMNLIPNLSVLDNVKLAIQAIKPFRFGMFRSQNAYTSLLDEAQSLLDRWGLWGKRQDLMQELSYGQQRRVELIMALASKPKILLLDEPTSGLSEAAAASFLDMIRELGRDITVVIVEHDMDVVFDLADYITVLHHGEVIAEGTGREIKDNHMVKEIYLGEES